MLLKGIVFVLFCLILGKQIAFIKRLVVATKKSMLDNVSIFFGILILLWLTYQYANTILDYSFAVLGISALLTMIYKQGIAMDGLILLSRGHEFYPWSEIGSVKIEEADDIKVIYYSTIGSPIIKQRYAKKNKDKLFDILEKNSLYKEPDPK
ncbi:hypothetical protein lbkm_0354 [Lachnospiraceae bacterium KM106-2]|nr:hypothetical protein lbkm_0354 [Lachnospiraceae bacterium KM106-2]